MNSYSPGRKLSQDTPQKTATKGLQPRPFKTEEASEHLTDTPLKNQTEISNAATNSLTTYPNVVVTAPSITPLSQPIQAKLTIGESNDQYEQEADRVAHEVLQRIHDGGGANASRRSSGSAMKHSSGAELPSPLQRVTQPEEPEVLPATPLIKLQRVAAQGGVASDELEQRFHCARGSSQGLEPKLQTQIGQTMEADFSRVRVYTDAQADRLSRRMSEKAFVTGPTVFSHQATALIQRDVEATPTFQGHSSDAYEGGGNFLEFISDAYDALKTYKDGNSSKFDQVSSVSKAVGGFAGTVLAGLKLNEVEKMTGCLETFSEGMKILDAGKEVWEVWQKADLQDWATLEKISAVVHKFGDFILNAGKIANGFVNAMAWTKGVVASITRWLPLSELIMKCVNFMGSVKQWIAILQNREKLKKMKESKSNSHTNNSSRKRKNKEAIQQLNYLIEEQWSKLKNKFIPISASGLDFASEMMKYFSSYNPNVAFATSIGTLSKAIPLGHRAATTVYDSMRQGWRKTAKSLANKQWLSQKTATSWAAVDKADLKPFREGLVTFVFNSRNGPDGITILESLGLGKDVQKMSKNDALDAIREAVKDIK